MTTTKTRLTYRANGDANSYALLDDAGNWFMSVLLNGEQLPSYQDENLKRLAACWNKFAEIPTDAIESMPGTVRDLVALNYQADDALTSLMHQAETAAKSDETWAAFRASILATVAPSAPVH